MCQTKKVIDDISDEEFVFLDTVHTEIAVVEGNTKPWTTDIQLNGDLTEFKIDAGADVIVIPATMYKEPRDKGLQSADKILVNTPCQSKVHSELLRMEKKGVISQVKDQPTGVQAWLSSPNLEEQSESIRTYDANASCCHQ